MELGIDLPAAPTLQLFEQTHGSLDNYDILLYHPGIQHAQDILEVRRKDCDVVILVDELDQNSRYREYRDEDVTFIDPKHLSTYLTSRLS